MEQSQNIEHSPESCKLILLPIRDALDVLNGKWKVPIIIALEFDEKRFTEISREIHGITDRMLSKELRDLEFSGLIARKTHQTYPAKVTYSLTPHGRSLHGLIESLKQWGITHRQKFITSTKE
jgi:DNA-binding HxlR family transcriptional regulator